MSADSDFAALGFLPGVPAQTSSGEWAVYIPGQGLVAAKNPNPAMSAADIESIARLNAGSTYYNGENISIWGKGGLNEILTSKGLTIEGMMRARDAANGGTPFAYDPVNNAWDRSTQKAIQANVANPSSGVAPQVTANVAKAVNGVSLPAGTGTKTTAGQNGQVSTESGYDPLTLILGGVLFVLLIFLFAGSAIKRGVSHGV